MAASFTLLDGTGKTIPLARMSDGAYRPADTVSEAAKVEERAEADGTQAAPTLVEKVNALTLDAKTGKARIEYLAEGTYQLGEDRLYRSIRDRIHLAEPAHQDLAPAIHRVQSPHPLFAGKAGWGDQAAPARRQIQADG